MRSAIASVAMLGVALILCQSCSSGSSTEGNWKTISSSSNGNNSIKSTEKDVKGNGFLANLPEGFVKPTDDVGRKLFKEYGSVFVAKGGVTPPKIVVFKDDSEVSKFQSAAPSSQETVSGVSIELQSAAMKALNDAVTEAKQSGASITPKGADAAKRTYPDTVGLWASRVDPGLEHWSGNGRISAADAERIRSLPPFDQVSEIFKLESQGIYFAKDLSKSIIYSVAPPGSSQHLSMLALDVAEHENTKVRAIMAKHGWFQTVISDLPHFTFLGASEGELPKLGLKRISNSGRTYWIPDI